MIGLILGLGNIAIFANGPAPGTGTVDALRYAANHRLQFDVGNGVLGAGLLLILPAMLGLFFALRDLGRARILIATAFGALGVVGLLYLLILVFSLPGLDEGYVAVSTDAQRTAYVTVAGLVLSQISSALVALTFLLSTWVPTH